MQENWVLSLGWEDLLEKGMATYSSILAWRISWTEEPGRPQYLGSQRVGHGWVTNIFTFPLKLRLASGPRWVEEVKTIQGLLQESRWDHDFPDYESSIGNRETWTDFDHWMWKMREREGKRISPNFLTLVTQWARICSFEVRRIWSGGPIWKWNQMSILDLLIVSIYKSTGWRCQKCS